MDLEKNGISTTSSAVHPTSPTWPSATEHSCNRRKRPDTTVLDVSLPSILLDKDSVCDANGLITNCLPTKGGMAHCNIQVKHEILSSNAGQKKLNAQYSALPVYTQDINNSIARNHLGKSMYMSDRSRRLRNIDQLPDWYYVYPNVNSHYRPPMSVPSCIRSLFQIHNETVNIWSHLVGAAYWVYMLNDTIYELYIYKADKFTITLTYLCYALCLTMPILSSSYHLFKPVTPNVAKGCLRLDMFGILCLWFARVLLEGHYVLWENPFAWRLLLLFAIPIFFILSPIALKNLDKVWPLIPCFIMAHIPLICFFIKLQRSVTLVGIGKLWIFFAIFGLQDMYTQILGLDIQKGEEIIPILLLRHMQLSLAGTLCAIVGYTFFVSGVPERWWPGKVDIFGSSHQIWHIFVFLGPTLILLGFQYQAKYHFEANIP